MRPLWSLVTATDMNSGRHKWSRSIGPASDYIRNHPDLQGLDLDFDNMGHPMIRPSPLLTSSLLFLAEAGHLSGDPGGPMFRAYDKQSGEVLAELELPSKATGAPMTHMFNGFQYIVIAVATAQHPAELVALALPGAAVSVAVTGSASNINTDLIQPVTQLSAEELRLSGDLFTRLCVSCHGDQGRGIIGGSAPSLLNAGSVESIKQIIQNGGVEMPAYQLQLTEQEMSLLSRYVNQLVQ